MNDHGKSRLTFAPTGAGTFPEGDWRETPAIRSAHSLVEYRLCEGFAELDCQTGDVQVRQQLYATLVHKAICIARQRLPENAYLDEVISVSNAAAEDPGSVDRQDEVALADSIVLI